MIRPQAVELEQVNSMFVAFLRDFFEPDFRFEPTSGMCPYQKWTQTGNGWQEPDSIPSNVWIRNKKKGKHDQAVGCGAVKLGVCCIFG